MNILPKKSFHVGRRANLDRVRKDEEEAGIKEKKQRNDEDMNKYRQRLKRMKHNSSSQDEDAIKLQEKKDAKAEYTPRGKEKSLMDESSESPDTKSDFDFLKKRMWYESYAGSSFAGKIDVTSYEAEDPMITIKRIQEVQMEQKSKVKKRSRKKKKKKVTRDRQGSPGRQDKHSRRSGDHSRWR